MIAGIGIDLVEIERLRKVLQRQGPRLLDRVFTEQEQQYCSAHRDPVPSYAARFAAKEALFKALGTGWSRGVRWVDAEVLRRRGQAPRLQLHGRAASLSAEMGVQAIHLSLSHSETAATAFVILETTRTTAPDDDY
jgi:holo-[acyl-carrier protein] synthase